VAVTGWAIKNPAGCAGGVWVICFQSRYGAVATTTFTIETTATTARAVVGLVVISEWFMVRGLGYLIIEM